LRCAEEEDAAIYWGVETGVNNCENVEHGFSRKGHPPVLPVEIKRVRVNMISAISDQGPVRFILYQNSMNQQRLIEFMCRLVRMSRQKVFLILDNLKVHHRKLVTAWLGRHRQQIEVFFLPPYAPEYNPDKYLNHTLKLPVHSGKPPYSAADISHKIQFFMCMLQHNPCRVSAFFRHSRLSYLYSLK